MGISREMGCGGSEENKEDKVEVISEEPCNKNLRYSTGGEAVEMKEEDIVVSPRSQAPAVVNVFDVGETMVLEVLVSADKESPNFVLYLWASEHSTMLHLQRRVNEVLKAANEWNGDTEVCVGFIDPDRLGEGADGNFDLGDPELTIFSATAFQKRGDGTFKLIALTAGCDHGGWDGVAFDSYEGDQWVILDLREEQWGTDWD